MILDPQARIFEAALKEPGRYALHAVRLRLLDGRPVLEASNGRILARVEALLEDGDDMSWLPAKGVLLDANAMREGWKWIKRTETLTLRGGATEDWVLAHGPMRVTVGTIEGEFPKVDKVVPKAPAEGEGQYLTFDVAYLAALVKAVGADVVTLELPPSNKHGEGENAIVVLPRREQSRIPGALGALMPIILDGRGGPGNAFVR